MPSERTMTSETASMVKRTFMMIYRLPRHTVGHNVPLTYHSFMPVCKSLSHINVCCLYLRAHKPPRRLAITSLSQKEPLQAARLELGPSHIMSSPSQHFQHGTFCPLLFVTTSWPWRTCQFINFNITEHPAEITKGADHTQFLLP